MGTKKTFLTAAAASVALAAVPTAASAAPSGGLTKSYDAAYERVVDAGGQPGRNIADDGVQDGGKARAATSAELRESLGTLRSMVASAAAPAQQASTSTGASGSAGQTGQTGVGSGQATGSGQAAPAQSSGGSGGDLSGVAQCESGGDPGAVSPDGQYRGKYQFDQRTWESVGGSGDPAAAPEAEQDQRAQQLQAQRGSSPWPVCGG
ncbi:transglycosylase family protein [Patulibacter minatonensis]|uniref:transglycosylase family protein n=1 Tax=Patulibacter minatonensis TaxID=298163 RepID=UPI0004788710|nr:transglycosylase family protein [Patulibacter minatonensis]